MAEQSDGSDPKTFQKTCYGCNAVLLSTTAKFCSECGLSQHVNEPPNRKQCVHCEFQLPLNAEYCSKCCSPQDPRTYRNSTFKKCCNLQCNAHMLHKLSVCYSCRQEQSAVPIHTPTQELLSTPLKPIQMRQVEHLQSLETPVGSKPLIPMDDLTARKTIPTDLSSPLTSQPSVSLYRSSSTPDDYTTTPDIVPYPASPLNDRKIIQTELGKVSNGTALPEISNEVNSEMPPPIIKRVVPQNRSTMPRGFSNFGNQNVMCIMFKVVIPTQLWGWDDKSEVYMRFGHDVLGKWEYDFGPGVKRECVDYIIMKFLAYFEVAFVKRTIIQYKYMVYSERTMTQDDAYEYLNYKGTVINRVIHIPSNKCIANGVYFQYDTMACPRSFSTVNKKERFTKLLKERAEKKQEQIIIPEPSLMSQMCLEIHLIPSRSLFTEGNFYDTFDVSPATNRIVRLFESIYEPIIPVTQYGYVTTEKKKMESVKKEMMDWLVSIVNELADQDKLHKCKKVSSAVCLLVAYAKLSQKSYVPAINEELAMSLLKMIALSPSGEEYEYLKTLMKSDISKNEVKICIINLFSEIASKTKKKQNVICLFKCLPIIHFLRDDCIPHQVISLTSSHISFGLDSTLKMNAVHFAMTNKTGFIREYIDELKMMFPLDPLLMPTLVYICPRDDLPLLCDYVPLSLIMGMSTYRLGTLETLKKGDIDAYVIKPLGGIQSKFLISSVSEHTTNCIDSLKKLSTVLIRFLNCSEKDKETILVFVSTTLAFIFHHDTPSGDTTTECRRIVEQFLEQWICKPSVIGSPIFGGSVQYSQNTLSKLEPEVKIWEFFLNTDVKELQKLPPHIKDIWFDIISSLMKSRIGGVPNEIKVYVLCELEKDKHTPESLRNLFINQTVEALNQLFTSDKTSLHSLFERAQSSKSIQVARVFGNLLKKRYPNFQEGCEVPLIDLLKWDLWPGFIKLYGLHLKEAEDWHNICACAYTQLEVTCRKIISGHITMDELNEINLRKRQVVKLCTSSESLDVPSIEDLEMNVNARQLEYQYFTEFKKQLDHFTKRLKNVCVQDLSGIQCLLKRNNRGDLINSLCTTTPEGTCQIKGFGAAEAVYPYIEKFFIISSKYANTLFESFWLETLSQVGSNNEVVTFQQVVDHVWKPVLDQCIQLLNDLQTCHMLLSDVDKVLNGRYPDQDNFMNDIALLYQAVNECSGKGIEDFQWIRGVYNRIWHYWNLCNYHENATSFLEICNRLGLTGDFSLIESIANKNINIEGQTLQSSIINVCCFLKDFGVDKRECLVTFAECKGIVEWIRNLRDASDLQNFVTIALNTAAGGEGDLNTDRLSNLRKVGSAFSKFIFELPKDAGYQVLLEHCEDLGETLEQTRDLPEIMRYCESEISWYQSIWEMQGSVEKTSFGQMRSINELGYYEIGSIRKGILSSRSEAIRLKLRKPDNKKVTLPKYRYSLDELRDLESKLVLITGTESIERQEVDQFLDTFHSVCRIADVLIELQHHGNSEYLRWKLQFPCAIPSVLELLKYQARKMETVLESWMNEVNEKRDKFYELNYYTTSQLLALSEGLGQFSSNLHGSPSIKADVMNLLHSISQNVTLEEIKTVLKKSSIILANTDLVDENSALFSSLPKTPYFAETDHLAHDSEVDGEEPVLKEKRKKLINTSQEKMKSNCPKPQIQLGDLTQEQTSQFYNLEECGYHKKLILLAFERCKNRNILEEVAKWCRILSEDYSDEDVSSSETEEEEEENYEEEEEEFGQQKDSISETMKSPHSLSECFEEIQYIPVDENHPNVQILMSDYEFPLELSIIAVCRHPNNIQLAMKYLTMGEAEENSSIVHSLNSDEEEEIRGNSGRSHASEGSLECLQKMRITIQDKSIKTYLSLTQLGLFLQKLSMTCQDSAPLCKQRTFLKGLKSGECNFLIVAPELVLKTTLSLYMEDLNFPMPAHEEVLVCNNHTTAEEVILLWKRALGDLQFLRIFCLVNAERLPYQTCEKSLSGLQHLSQGKRDYRIVIICSNEDEEKSHIVSRLQPYRRTFSGIQPDESIMTYLKDHFIEDRTEMDSTENSILASVVDKERSCVRVVTSERAGMGKSLYIHRLTEDLMTKTSVGPHKVIIPIHGPKVTSDSVVSTLMNYWDNTNATIFHLDISPNVLRQLDSILFCLLVLQAICDSKGRVWRCHPTHMYAIEVTIPKTELSLTKCAVAFLNLLPSVKCVSPKTALRIEKNKEHFCTDSSLILTDKKEFESPMFQRSYQYLHRYVSGLSLDEFSYEDNTVEGNIVECLNILLREINVKDPSWSELRHFVCFLDIQLRSCENSPYCNEEIVGDVMSGFKTFAVKFMITMSKDFSASSLKGEVAVENEDETIKLPGTQQYEVHNQKMWDRNCHPYLFFNETRGSSNTFIGFRVNGRGDLIDPVKNKTIETAIMTPELLTALQRNHVNFSENYYNWGKQKMVEKIGIVMGIEHPSDPDPSYVLTVDNVIKILAILMKFRCSIPVVVMGETGCGKTRLIRYMCDLAAQGGNKERSQDSKCIKNLLIMKVHGGSTEADIIKKVEEAEELAKENKEKYGLDTVLFFDEANTTAAIDLIKEVMCDHHINGREITRDIKFIAACNPYKKHRKSMIVKLESAGLGFYVKATETQEKLGEIPLRQLVYRVLDLPPSMRPLVYDFGRLDDSTENDYIKQMVHDRCSTVVDLNKTNCINAVADVLTWSQSYMKRRTDECSFVSLRDIERALIVFKYFYEKNSKFKDFISAKAKAEGMNPVDSITWSLIISLSVCYLARLQIRDDYEKEVVKQFRTPLDLPGGVEQFRCEIKWCQNVLLDNMEVGHNIARNAALRENVFMMAVCIQLRIPLFLVGKPGSSKSLAKSIIADSLGEISKKDFLKDFNKVHMFSYQCSRLSTSESLIEVFNAAKTFQEKQNTAKFVSVVVLEEVGLAEDSPNLPLKALHPLLEDGTEGADDSQQIIDQQQRVAFIGISNWALDPAKMNRGVMVTRDDPDQNELILSADQICSNDSVKKNLSPYFKHLAAAYKEICEEKSKSFFGLRDFYSLIKMLYWMCERTRNPPTEKQLEHAIKRNFGGLKELNTYKIFMTHLGNIDFTIPQENNHLFHPDCTPLGLIETSLRTKETTWHGENRYLLFLTENYAALQVLKHKLHEAVSMSSKSNDRKKEPFVLFGSSFPKDREYTQVCRNINQIKICMETGRTVILLNLENLYESLYDMLNQYYISVRSSRYVDLGLQTHRVKCRVDNEFKLILIAEKETVYNTFPTPLINRLEKHFVLTETILLDWQKEVLVQLNDWINQFSCMIEGSESFTTQDAFVGFQNDTPASVIFQVTKQLRDELHLHNDKDLAQRKSDVLQSSCNLLLQMATPDALIRLQHTALADQQKMLCQVYCSEQYHESLTQFLQHHINSAGEGNGLLIQITTHSHLLSNSDLKNICKQIGYHNNQVSCFLLQEFDTELDFTKAINTTFSNHGFGDNLLIIQCDSGHLYGDLVACARYRIDDEREKALLQKEKDVEKEKALRKKEKALREKKVTEGITHVLFIIHLPRRGKTSFSFVGFQGGSWISAHIDDIHVQSEAALTLDDALNATISELFYNMPFLPEKMELTTQNMEQQPDESQQIDELEVLNREPHMEYSENQQTAVLEFPSNVSDIEKMGLEQTKSQKESEEPVLEYQEEEIIEYSNTSHGFISEEMDRDEELELSSESFKQSSIREENNKEEEMDSVTSQNEENDEEEVMKQDTSRGSIGEENEEEEMDSVTSQDEENDKEEEIDSVTSRDEEEEETESDASHGSIDEENEEEEKHYTQCRRLYHCIHAVVAKIAERDDTKQEWAARRVKLLLDLIPSNPNFPLSIETFYGALVKHILFILKQREEAQQYTEWVLKEALNGRNLHSGGTFQNVLARKLDEVIVPIFVAILSSADNYSNLEIMGDRDNLPKQRLWLHIFNNPRIFSFSFHYKERFHNDESFETRKLHGTLKEDFTCQFPFFWLIKNTVDSSWGKVLGTNKQQEVLSHLCASLENSPIAEVLHTVPSDLWEDFCHDYLHDYLQSVHHVAHSKVQEEYKLLGEALYAIVTGTEVSGVTNSLLTRLVGVHVAYHYYQKEIMWLGQLISLIPGILVKLHAMEGYNDKFMDIHLHAVKFALEDLELPLKKDTREHFPQRLLRLQSCQTAINSIIEISSGITLVDEIRSYWHYIKLIQLFVEHVALKYEDLIVIAKRLELHFNRRCDFSKIDTITGILQQLNSMEKNLENKKKIKANQLVDIRKCTTSFFTEVVSILCFGQQNPPHQDLIMELIKIVFDEQLQSTKDFGFSERDKADKIPVVRSFLLRLLVGYNSESVIECVNLYLSNSRKMIQDNHSICLLTIQCLEDAILKKSVCQDIAKNAMKLLAEGETAVKLNSDASLESNITIEHLEAIAKLRFVCSVVGDLLYKYNEKGGDNLTPHETELLQSMKKCCNDDKLNSMEAGPALFILKQVARQHGMSFLASLSKSEKLEWVIPAHLRKQDEIIIETLDPFLIYQVYGDLKRNVIDALRNQKLQNIQDLPPSDAVPLLLSIYQVVTMSHVYSDKDTRRVTSEAESQICTFTKNCQIFDRELKWSAQTIIQCTHCEKLKQMQPKVGQSLQDRMTTEVVIHAAITFQAKRTLDVMQPFIKLLYSPGELKESYLPAFPGEILFNAARISLEGAFNKCPREHFYFVLKREELTRRHKCPSCNMVVEKHNNESENEVSEPQVGYTLGDPTQREIHPDSERNLSPAACAILRILVNACLVWTACTNENATQGLLEIVGGKVRPKDLPTFFWQHLECDISMLSSAVGKSKDDACLLLHLVLKNINTMNFPQTRNMKVFASLKSEEDRTIWENSFNVAYIQPILKKLDSCIQDATQQLLEEKETKEQDYLYYTVYEKVAISPNTVLPHLWSYRPRITLDHLYQILQTQRKDFPILHELLKEEPILRATQYLPGIAKLQHQLYELYHRKLDLGEANKITVTEFLENLESDSKRKEFQCNLQCVKSAWELVKNRVYEFARVHVPAEYLSVSWDDESLPLAYLIPTVTGPGVCTVILLDLLVTAHNGFLKKCQNELRKKHEKENIWGEYKVPVSHIQYCHLLDYEHQIISIVLSHCHYSLRHGEGQVVTYDLPALEKHFVDQFVHGKPLIQLHIQQITYRKDAFSIANIRKRVAPQIKLGAREKAEIIKELHTIKSLRDCLDIVEIMMGFLSSGHTDPEIELRTYVSKSLKMGKKFSCKKALDYCKLGHVLSLWETLSVEMAKRLTYIQQEPFVGLNDEYLNPLLNDQLQQLKNILHGVDIGSLLDVLYEFIETFIRHEYPKSDLILIDKLVEHYPAISKDTILPKSITVGQAVDTWKEIAYYEKEPPK